MPQAVQGGRAARSHSQPRGTGRIKSPDHNWSVDENDLQVVPPLSKPNGSSRPNSFSIRNSVSKTTHSAQNAVPPEVQAQQKIQDAARQGSYTLLSVLHSGSVEGFIQFINEPGWLRGIFQQCQNARAFIVALNVDDPQDQSDLVQLVKVIRASDLRGRCIFAVPMSIDNANLIRDKADKVKNVLLSGVDDFIFMVDSGLSQMIESALMRIDIQKRKHYQEINEVQQECEYFRNQMDYMQWQWIPSQLRLDAIPAVDPNLEEENDGSIADLQFIRSLGRGAFGMVHEARTAAGQTLAVKVMRKDNAPTITEVERIYREVQILSSLPNHQNLARLHFVLHSVDTVYICLAYGGPENLYHLQLRQPNNTFPMDMAQELFGEIADAVGHMHRNSFFHRDIKPENIAVNGNEESGYHTMLVDCGLAVNSNKPLRQMCGSLPFAAPEILDVPCRYFGGPADAFALGMLLFEIVRGQSRMENVLGWTRRTEPSPHRARQLRVLLVNGPPNVNRDRNEPPEIMSLFVGLLNLEPSQRLTVVDLLRSPWLSITSSEQRMPALPTHSMRARPTVPVHP